MERSEFSIYHAHTPHPGESSQREVNWRRVAQYAFIAILIAGACIAVADGLGSFRAADAPTTSVTTSPAAITARTVQDALTDPGTAWSGGPATKAVSAVCAASEVRPDGAGVYLCYVTFDKGAPVTFTVTVDPSGSMVATRAAGQ